MSKNIYLKRKNKMKTTEWQLHKRPNSASWNKMSVGKFYPRCYLNVCLATYLHKKLLSIWTKALVL